MAMKSFNSLSALILLLLHRALSSPTPLPGNDHPTPLFIFGDSYLDVGNNNYINTTALDRANFWPYGETFFHYPTGRFSNGRIVPDLIAGKANLSFIPPYLQPGISHYFGVNFASAGAGALVETFQGSVIDLKTQLKNFMKVEQRLKYELGESKAKMKISNGVYIIAVGSNDYMAPFLTNSTAGLPKSSTYVEMVIGNLTSVIKEIYGKGGTKFGFVSLPPLGCLPGLRILTPSNDTKCYEEVSSLARLHNRALYRRLVELKNELSGFKYSLYDFNTFLLKRIKHPSKYGFIAGKEACCGTGRYRGVYSCGGKRIVKEYELCEDPSHYIFWDSYHLTERIYQQLAEEMWGGIENKRKLGSYNLKDLFQGI